MLTSSNPADTLPVNTTDTAAQDAAAQGRRLNEDVLQSAEDAVLSNPDAAAVLVDAPAAGMLSRCESAVTGYVARQPLQSALLALVAGAAAAALLRSALHRRQARQSA